MPSAKRFTFYIFFAVAAILILSALLFCPDNLLNAVFNIASIIFPFILGICLAFLFNKPLELILRLFKLKNCVSSRTIAALILIILLFSAIVFLAYPATNSLSASFSKLINDIPKIFSQVSSLVNGFTQKFGFTLDLSPSKIMFENSTDSIDITLKVYEWISKFISDISISLISAVYMVIYKDSLLAQLDKFLFAVFNNKGYFLLMRVGIQSNKIFSGYFSGKLLQCLLISLTTFIPMFILKTPYALIVAIIMGFFNIIAFIGPLIGAIPCVILLYIDSPITAIWFIGVTLASQLIIGQVLGPKLLGDSTGLPSFWVFFAVIAGAYIGGIIGMIIGIPIFAVIYIFIKEAVNLRINKKDSHKFEREYKKVYNNDIK